MKIAWFKREISPEVGCYLSGYSAEDVSVAKTDDLFVTGFCADDGERKVLILSFDVNGMDEWYIKRIRKDLAALLGTDPAAVLFTCTHNHSGPETRTMRKFPDHLNTAYLEKLENILKEEVKKLKDFRECSVYFYSSRCDENRNRRYTTACNNATFTPHRREVVPIALEYADKELGQLCFIDSETRLPIYVIGNYAAHPLAGHAPGFGGKKISADYPGAFREYVTAETGAECMFISGAAGDLVPREDELGSGAARQMGVNLAKAAIGGLIDSTRNPGRFGMPDAKVGFLSKIVKVPFRKNKIGRLPVFYDDKPVLDMELQLISIGDVCFVGVPGELCCELGQEIKWHSPFRKAFIAYQATGHLGYIGSVNMMISGGYEGNSQCFDSRCGLALVNASVDGMFELRESLFENDADDSYPNCLAGPLVNIPANR